MDVYPFFLECSKHEKNPVNKTQFERLAFGKGGMIIEKNGNTVLCTVNGDFIIPTHHTPEKEKEIRDLLVNKNTNYFKMENDIKEARKTWTNVKKRDKLRIIDHYVVNSDLPTFAEKQLLKSIITIALILKMIQNQDIHYKDFNIEKLNGKFDKYYFDEHTSVTPVVKTNKFPPPTKNMLKSVWNKHVKNIADDD